MVRFRSTVATKGRWYLWLSPGLSVKRWLALSAVGVLLTSIGLAILFRLTPIFYVTRFLSNVVETLVQVFPNTVSGPIAILLGVGLIWWGQKRTLGTLTQVLMPEGDAELVDLLRNHQRLNRGPKIVAIGGGTGLSALLRGLKSYSANITAIVTVADDGGSSGRLRREIGVLPPGDIRNCLAALADEEKLITELFQYRFKAGDGLIGHSFGNLFLTALSDITGDLEQAIAASSRVLAVRGRVLPATLTNVSLWAELADGRRIEGESNITEAGGSILRIGCVPEHPPALPRAIAALKDADYIILGPGSLYTSVIPNLLVSGMVETLRERRVPRIYVCNIMSQPGETQGYTVSDHVRAIDRAAGARLFDAVLVQKTPPSEQTIRNYREIGAHPVILDREKLARLGCRILLANIMEESESGLIRHDPERLANVLLRWYSRVRISFHSTHSVQEAQMSSGKPPLQL
ncbi:gluconeogenesis factor YvcK family protein [Leptolyngbya sp. FACHB-261]|uniref:gluconeogenesis factor YvcK family protein n=1 Tax=Leptolyngbya sp. FACHB-261 TaxID=2692806 RepID=UPI0016850433|nr:gluconeogenesis factor YvcK family protein [Leptolyngbya sp. FACHB-261]MBD2105093.1 YvcK family protein [Leptolyngbya sp. FACHB-261]